MNRESHSSGSQESIGHSESANENNYPTLPGAEYSFHQKRFAGKAAKENEGRLAQLKARLGIGSPVTAVDMAHEEALRDDADFEYRQSAEFKKESAALQPVMEEMFAKRDLSPEQTAGIRILKYEGWGGAKGNYGIGQDIAQKYLGLDKTIDVYIGDSAGAGNVAQAATGHPERAAASWIEDCTGKDFFDPSRITKGVKGIIDNSKAASGMRERGGKKEVDVDALLATPAEVFVGATNRTTGTYELLDLKTVNIDSATGRPDPVAALEASAAFPIIGEAVEVNGKNYWDAALAEDKQKWREIIKRFKPTSILIQPNLPFDPNALKDVDFSSFGQWSMSPFVRGGAPNLTGEKQLGSYERKEMIYRFFKIKENMRLFFEEIQRETGVKVGILWPPDQGLSSLPGDPDSLKAAIYESARATIRTFGGEEPHFLPILPEEVTDEDMGTKPLAA